MKRLLSTLKANLLARETWFFVLGLAAVSLVISLIVKFTFTVFCDALSVLSVIWIVLSFSNGFRNTSFADREKGMLTLSRWMLHAVADNNTQDDDDEEEAALSNVMLTSGLICLIFSVIAAFVIYARNW